MNLLYSLILILLAVFAIAPLEYPGAFESHSGLSAVYNLINLDQNPLQFFNWAPTFGRTYDLFRTEGALPYWIAEVFHRVGFGYLDSVKLVYALAWIGSGLAMFALARRFFSDEGALLAATVYVYLPFHIATVYVRGAFAESVAWAILPVAMLAIFSQQLTENSEQSAVKSKPSSTIGRWILSILPFALLYWTQPGIAILFAFFAISVVVALNWRGRSFLPGIAPIVIGLGVGALLSVPVIMRYGARIAADGFSPNFILPYQLFSSLWGFGPSPTTTDTSQGTLILDQFPFQIGVVPIGLAIIAIALNWANGREATISSAPITPPLTREVAAETSIQAKVAPTRRIIATFLIAAFVLALLTFEIAAPIWNLVGVFAANPWQLLAFAGLALAFVAGSVIDLDARLAQPAMFAFFVALPVVSTYGYFAPRYVDMSPTRPHIAIFGNNEIALLNYRIVGPLRHGATVRIEAKWQALRAIDHDYTVFVHAVDETGKTWAQDDSKPQDGALPTIKWIPGQIIFDTHTIQIDVDGPREGYHIEFGLYQAANGQRAAIESGADQLILPRAGDPPPTISDQLPPNKTQ